jgi:hypothetical protein
MSARAHNSESARPGAALDRLADSARTARLPTVAMAVTVTVT